MFKTIMQNMKIGGKNDSSKSINSNETHNSKKEKNNQNLSTNNSQLLTMHQQQFLKQENAKNLKNQQAQANKNMSQQLIIGQNQQSINQQRNSLQLLHQQQQQNQIAQHLASLQQLQQSQNRNVLSNSNTLSNLNRSATGTLPRQINGTNYISNSLSTSAINNNVLIREDPNLLNRQLNGHAIYGRTVADPNQTIYNTLNKPIISINKNNSIYGISQVNNGNLIYNRQQNLIQGQPIYGQTNMNQLNNFYDEDPGIMSEVETASTGFRRMNKVRSSLPVVRTMSKTTDRSLGIVFLQFKNETKKSLLPNEITSFDTIKALFVRSFPNQLNMSYFDDKNKVRFYIHDQTKDMFFELEDLKDVKDRSILKVYEKQPSGAWLPADFNNMMNSVSNNQSTAFQQKNNFLSLENRKDEINYFSEPELDAGFNQMNNLHKKRLSATFSNNYKSLGNANNIINCGNNSQYYGTIVVSAQQRQEALAKQEQLKQLVNISSTLPRGTHLNSSLNSNNTPPPKPQRSFNAINTAESLTNKPYLLNNKIPYSLQQSINSTNSSLFDKNLPDRPYSVAGHYSIDNQFNLPMQMARSFHEGAVPSYLTSPERKCLSLSQQQNEIYGFKNNIDNDTKMKIMEKQIENLTGIVETVLKPTLNQTQIRPKNGLKQNNSYDLAINNSFMNNIFNIKSKAKLISNDLQELRKFTCDQKKNFKDYLNQISNEFKNNLGIFDLDEKHNFRLKRLKLGKEEKLYREDVSRLEKDLTDLELNVEKLRASVISRKCRVNMVDVENMALSLSRAGKCVSDLKSKFPELQNNLKIIMTKEMQVVVDEEKFLKEEPDRLENALRRCKKLTGTLVTLKRLASVQEQRCSANKNVMEKCLSTDSNIDQDGSKNPDMIIQVTPATPTLNNNCKPENVLDNLLHELQTFTNPSSNDLNKKINSINSAPENLSRSNSNESTGILQKCQNKKSLEFRKKSVPPPPPRSSSSKITEKNGQKLVSNSSQDSDENSQLNGYSKMNITRSNSEPSSKSIRPKSTPPENRDLMNIEFDNCSNLTSISHKLTMMDNLLSLIPSTSTNSLSSVGSQDSVIDGKITKKNRQQVLEERHQDLLRKQKLLQEQYLNLQKLSRGELPNNILNELKKTGSENNLLLKGINQVPNESNCSVQNGLKNEDLKIKNLTNSFINSKNNSALINQSSSPNKVDHSIMNGNLNDKNNKFSLESNTETQTSFDLNII